MKVNRTTAAVVAVILTAGVGAGVAGATIPDSNGVIHTCYNNSGKLRVIDTQAGQTCKRHENALNWDQLGPAGPAGPPGSAGPQGPAGATNVVVRFASAPIPANSYGHAVAQCHAGERATGGGVSIAGVHGIPTDSVPNASPGTTPTGWFGQAKTDATADTVYVYVVCASP